ncbi:MAG: FHA domain-containing protein, partial [Polyangiaceae bacterium]
MAEPPRRFDSRREPDLEEDDCPTDVLYPKEVVSPIKLRLESQQPASFDGEAEPTDVGLAPVVRLVSLAPLPLDVRAYLEVKSGPAVGPIELTMTRVVIGRANEADVRVVDSKTSRKHAEIFYTGQEFRIRDEGSANGTLLNGSRVVEYVLRDG